VTATAQGPGHEPVRLVSCPTCGLAQTVGHLAAGTRAFCSRCDQPLAQRAGDAQGQVALCFSLGALLLFVPANLWPILEVTTLGRTHTYTVASGVEALWHGSMWPLAIPVALASVLLPAALILLLLALSGAVQLGHPPGLPWRRLCGFLRAWAIADVYLLAIFVTVVKLAQLTDAAPALGAALFFAMVVCVVQALRSLDAAIAAAPDPVAPGPLADGGPSPDSASRTLALALGALVLFVPANIFPTLTVTMYGTSQSATVFDGVLDLWQAGMWPLAIIVVCASLLIPFFKIIGLLFLTLTLGHERHRRARTRVYRFIAQIGRWSMLDVYVISLIVAVLHFGALAGARAEIGAIAFVAVVIVTLQAARSFDPRLIWQEPGTDAAGARMGV
jgi:paraquat-inducible protein A